MTIRKKGIVAICILSLFLLVGCRQTGETNETALLATAQALMEKDQEVMEIFLQGDLDVDLNQNLEINATSYALVSDDRFEDLDDLEGFLDEVYSETNDGLISELLKIPDADAPLYVDSGAHLYRLAEFTGYEWPVADTASITLQDISDTTATIAYSYLDDEGNEVAATVGISKDADGAWLLDKSQYQVLGGLDALVSAGEDAAKGDQLYLYDPDSGEFDTEPIVMDDDKAITPENVVAALVEEMGVEITVNSVTVEGTGVHVDFMGDGPPLMAVGSAQETMILESISKTLVQTFPELTQVYYSADGENYMSAHYEYEKDVPYYEVAE